MKIHQVAPWLAIAALAGEAHSQAILRSVTGGAGQKFGSSITRYVDLDGDGLPELLVGSPGTNNSAGMVSVVSSKYLVSGLGIPVLWTVLSPSPNLLFGTAVLNLGDVSGDGVADFAVGAPATSLTIASEIDIVSGASHTILGKFKPSVVPVGVDRLGASLALGGDYDHDGFPDILTGLTDFAPFGGPNHSSGFLCLSSRQIVVSGNAKTIAFAASSPASDVEGFSISSGDVDGDGILDIITGAPLAGGFNAPGLVRVYSGANLSYGIPPQLLRTVAGTGSEGLGWSVDGTRDITGDGFRDILVGGPFAAGGGTQCGEAVVLSGAKLLTNIPPFDVQHWFGTNNNEHFGWSVAATPDVNGDLVGDAVVGSPDYSGILGGHEGKVTFFSGVTAENMATLVGSFGDHIGECVAAAWPYDGTIHFDIAAGCPQSNAGGTGSGAVRIVGLFPATPEYYCTAKLNSAFCLPQVGYSGSPSMSSPASFMINATNLLNNKAGLLLYGQDGNPVPFQGGYLCVTAPIKRVGGQSSGGNPPPNDCSGSMSFDFNARIRSGLDPALYLGRQVFAQYWSRDPNSPSFTGLTNALRFVINP